MKTVTQVIPYHLLYPISKIYVKEEIVFFDIETTGFSPEMSYVYLISCGYFEDDSWKLIQWFSEGIQEENQLLCLFFEFITKYKLLVHYNGAAFDMPFLLSKCRQHELPYNFSHITSLDIYKQIIPYKKRLPVENLQLKTVERFLGIYRKDTFHGGELIKVYADYVGRNAFENIHKTDESVYKVTRQSGLPTLCKTPAKEMLDALLLHNAEDVMGLIKIADILSYVDFFHGNFTHSQAIHKAGLLCITLTLENELLTPLKFDLTYSKVSIQVTAQKQTAVVAIPVVHQTLKFFFDNYKDYYYLPVEDTAIHKSVGEYVDKEFRQNAKANTCYVKKEGDYLIQPGKIFSPALQEDFKSKLFWFELTNEFLENEAKQIEYVTLLLA